MMMILAIVLIVIAVRAVMMMMMVMMPPTVMVMGYHSGHLCRITSHVGNGLVFTQPGSKPEILAANRCFPLYR
jgi:hypothetical protein